MSIFAYLRRMFKAFEFCFPTRGIKVPSTPDWLHEVKYDLPPADRPRAMTARGAPLDALALRRLPVPLPAQSSRIGQIAAEIR
jgi:hypothetical protein